MQRLTRSAAICIVVLLNATTTLHSAEIKFNPTGVDMVGIGSVPPSQEAKIEGVNGQFLIDQANIKWDNTVLNPLTYLITVPQIKPGIPGVLRVEFTSNVYGEFRNKLLVPIKLVEAQGTDPDWRNGQTKIFELPVTASRPCTDQTAGCEPRGPVCTLGNAKQYWRIGVAGYDDKASNAIAAHNAAHFAAFLKYTRPVPSLWEPLGIAGPVVDCCPCDPTQPPVCRIPISYQRWGPKSNVASAEWTGEIVDFTETDPTGTVKVQIKVPMRIADTFVQVNASFLEYVFNNQNTAPEITLTNVRTGAVVETGKIQCYNIALEDGLIKFVDTTKKPIRFHKQ